MDITISARHTTVPESLHDHAHRLGRRLDLYEPRAASLAINLDQVNGVRSAEARLSVAGRPPMIAMGTGPTWRNALNQAVDRIERQLRRSRQKRRQSRRAAAES